MLKRYKPLAYSRGRWVGFPRVHSYGMKTKAEIFIRKVRRKYKDAGLPPPRMKIKTITYK